MSGKVAAFPKAQEDSQALQAMLAQARSGFDADPLPSFKTRRQWLGTLKAMLLDNQDALANAIDQDFGGRARQESYLGELMPAVEGINHHLKQMRLWLQSERRQVGLSLWPAKAWVDYHPLGVVGIMVPWNYPLFLAIGPVTAALAAGNRALIKASEHTPRTSALLAKLVGQYFSPKVLQVVEGDAKVAAAFSRLPFDHLLFTGSTAVGHLVMRAAAENLTPVTLELGGKSPALIAPDMPLDLAVERILFGKCFNAGQTCVAPDYVLVPKGQGQAFIDKMQAGFAKRYPNWQDSPDYSSIINSGQYSRLCGYLDEVAQRGLAVSQSTPGRQDGRRRLGLHLVLDPPQDLALMRDEIFGPLLPVIQYDNLDQAVEFIKSRPKPLAFYPFSFHRKTQERLLQQVHAGGVCINDTLLHVAAGDLPFGGIGPSGMGHYHGREGVLTFSKTRPVLQKGRLSSSSLIYPPYRLGLLRWLYRLLLR
ncbi:coniferyl aldehyde dehydrogenase [Gallaecimonas xiamenensis]|uniref:Aldehyde dehydrogenase n=1 Tax=Gallaecimonas xiamenensis 3-C-1 TaxID=745411 RepID=K2J418_9GAMM|nr:coniferyl aldehyde dehydrogenase [Gallaecimonas xiamenensis]EKE69607.1 NAD-dependent aldehyde dehydrogenase [Gallaecimonas xiamenensis 3-C-1]